MKNNPVITSYHIILDFKYKNIVTDEYIKNKLISAVKQGEELTVLNFFEHFFKPYGVSLLFVLSESHLSVHTFPELNYISMDVYTCSGVKPEKTIELFLNSFEITNINKQEIHRGI